MRHPSRPALVTLVVLCLLAAPLAPAALADSEWECHGPGLVDPCRNTLRDVAVVPGTGGTEVWAVGDAGTILHYDEGAWQKMASPTTGHLRDVAAASADLAVAVGISGVLIEWDGARWTTCSYSSSDYFQGAALLPGVNNDGWTAGHFGGVGFFRHWNGSDWELKYKGEHYIYGGQVNEIAMLNGNNAWAVGDYIGKGQSYHWDGSDWDAVAVPDADLNGVDMVAANDAWAVGEEGALVHWDGAAWTQQATSPTEENLNDVSMVDGDSAWAVGEYGTVLKWNGVQWATDLATYMAQELHAVDMASETDGWAVGEGGTILRYDGTSWEVQQAPLVNRLEAIEVRHYAGGPEAWAAGSGRSLLHWDGVVWEAVPGASGISSYYDVSMVAPNRGWAAGSGGRIAEWDGATWQQTVRVDSIHCMKMLSATDGWGVGWSKIQHWDGAAWTLVDCPVSETFYGIHATAADDIWAVGDDGAIAHYGGGAWNAVASPEDTWLTDVGMVSVDEGYIVGNHGLIMRWDGDAWTVAHRDPMLGTLRGVSVVARPGGTAGWAVGHYGVLVKLDGGTWSQQESPTGNWIWAIDHVSPYEAWAVGDSGVILHWEDPARPTPTPMPTKDPANNVYLPLILR